MNFIEKEFVDSFGIAELPLTTVKGHGYPKEDKYGMFVINKKEAQIPVPLTVFTACYENTFVKIPICDIPAECRIVKEIHTKEDVIDKTRQEIYARMITDAEKKLSRA